MRTVWNISARTAAVLLLSLVVSCSKVRYSEPVTDDISPLTFTLDWSHVNLVEDIHPQAVTVMMTKVKSLTKHYLWSMDHDGNLLGITPPAEGEDVGETIMNGTYLVSGFSSYAEEDFIVSDIEQFETSGEVRMKDIYVEIPELTDDEVKALDLENFNPSSRYIRSVAPFYYVRPDNDGVHDIPEEGSVKLVLEQLTCNMSFSIGMNVEDGVQIERVVGVISGLPVRAYVMSGKYGEGETGKMCFEMTSESVDPESGLDIYTGSVNAFGIKASEDRVQGYGDGILNIIIRARVLEVPAGETQEREFLRVFNVTFNLKDMIDEAQIVKIVDQKPEAFQLAKYEHRFDMTSTLNVTKDAVMSDAQGGFDEWEKDESKDEGLNPEV